MRSFAKMLPYIGITGLWRFRVHIATSLCYLLDIGSSASVELFYLNCMFKNEMARGLGLLKSFG